MRRYRYRYTIHQIPKRELELKKQFFKDLLKLFSDFLETQKPVTFDEPEKLSDNWKIKILKGDKPDTIDVNAVDINNEYIASLFSFSPLEGLTLYPYAKEAIENDGYNPFTYSFISYNDSGSIKFNSIKERCKYGKI